MYVHPTPVTPTQDGLAFAPPRGDGLHHRHHAPHVYRNPCTRTWICDHEGTRAAPGPDRARTVCRTHLDALRVALSKGSAR
ncbi:hypothetical protein HUO13_25995 [Saccharopolyspora erythraea]|uniref:hypothetical protein n=1 Tax=Saccharopolyspora erythraea TaxID=1836 RepID=UPI001BA59C25|nr:hypothetical protein [Saccharopolyspora erythraea]QUH03806.1 hypothetical protein HUO13_25995 [Saccharopolyspora erythraea]